jgi:hypothetical protein
VAGSAAPALAADPLDGTWQTPLGAVRLELSDDGVYVGKLVDATRTCPFAKGTEVMHGRVVDGIFTGELKVCYPARCKLQDHWLLTMALIDDGGQKLSGAAAPANLSCPNNVFKGLPFVLERESLAAPASHLAPATEAPGPRKMKPEAQKLFREGVEYSGSGRYEAARTKLLLADQKDPHHPEILNLIGITYYARNDFRLAERYYRLALAADPSSIESRYNLACVLARQDKVRDSLRELREAVDDGFASVTAMDADHDLDAVRADPAYKEIRALAERNASRTGR